MVPTDSKVTPLWQVIRHEASPRQVLTVANFSNEFSVPNLVRNGMVLDLHSDPEWSHILRK